MTRDVRNQTRFKKLTSNQIRMLTEREIAAVAGGDGYGNIYVTGPSPTPAQPPIGSPLPIDYNLPPGITASTPFHNSDYKTAGASDAANGWASTHIRNYLGATGETLYDDVHDVLANLYQLSTTNPSAQIKLGDGSFVSAATAVNDYRLLTVQIASGVTGGHGADTYVESLNGNKTIITSIDPTSGGFQGLVNQYGNDGMNYIVLHELGHGLNFAERNDSTEPSADTTSGSLGTAVGKTTIIY